MDTAPSSTLRSVLELLHRRQAVAASAAAEDAVRSTPGDLRARRLLAAALRDAGRAAEALEVGGEATRAHPEAAAAHASLALSLAALGRTADALAAAGRARALSPEDPIALRIEGAYALGRDPAAAERAFRAALRASPTDPEIRVALARALERQGRRDEADEALAAAARIDPAFAGVREERRRALLALLQAGILSLLLVLALGFLPTVLATRAPGLAPALRIFAWLLAPVIPIAVMGTVVHRLRRRRREPIDPDARIVERELAAVR